MISNAIFVPSPKYLSFFSPKKSQLRYLSHLSLSALNYQPTEDFNLFLEKLRSQSPKEWTWLLKKFRNRLMPVLMSRAKNISSSALMTQTEFAEEVFEECLLKFYEIFENGRFEKYSDLEATIVRISDFKLKEGFAKIKRDQKLYFMDAEALAVMRERHLKDEDAQEKAKVELLANIQEHLSKLPVEESELILRFFNGEDLNHIANDYNIRSGGLQEKKTKDY